MATGYSGTPYHKDEPPVMSKEATWMLRSRRWLLSAFGIDSQCSLGRRIAERYRARGLRALVAFSMSKALTPLRSSIAYLRSVWYCGPWYTPGRFVFNGETCHYLHHPYNTTYDNERAVEVPIVSSIVRAYGGKQVLELGNVLAHYTTVDHDVVDKYEIAEGVISQDIVDFCPPKRYDLIVSISTLEHVGWDEQPQDPHKSSHAVRRLIELLAPEGQLVITVPLGQNPNLDHMIRNNLMGLDGVYFLKRTGGRNTWQQVTNSEIAWSYPGNICIGVYHKADPAVT